MKLSPVFYLLIALVLMTVVLVGIPGREKFQPEFLDKRQDAKTIAVEDSSYAQRTNHMQYGEYSMGHLQGMETPFQVNQYKAKVSKLFETKKHYRKKPIPKALREQVWLTHMGSVFEGKCRVSWCSNKITVFDFQCGHNIPESKGGKTTLANLIPICGRCNISMGDRYTITDWNKKFAGDTPPKKTSWFGRFWCRK